MHRLWLTVPLWMALPVTAAAFARQEPWRRNVPTNTMRFSAVSVATKPSVESLHEEGTEETRPVTISRSEEVRRRMEAQLERLRLKDKLSRRLSEEELDVIFEDEHVIVMNKPSGVLTVAGKDKTNHAFAQAVYDSRKSDIELSNADHMVVHRLGMDTSGLIVLAKTLEAVRGLNTAFRTREVERTYEALVCGHLQQNQGQIDLPLMRDYENPLYMRISTDSHQEALVDLDPEIVGKKMLEQPKESITEFKVIARETLNGQPVTRVLLRSVSGRMHQLNCHLAAWGHPIVGDTAYGVDGIAAPNGGLTDDEVEYLIPEVPPAQRATEEQQRQANTAVHATACHAKTLSFRHPVTKQQISLQSAAPF